MILEPLARRSHIALDLGHQPRRRWEARLVSQSFQEVQSDPLPIDIDTVYQQVPTKRENVISGFENGQLANIYTIQRRIEAAG